MDNRGPAPARTCCSKLLAKTVLEIWIIFSWYARLVLLLVLHILYFTQDRKFSEMNARIPFWSFFAAITILGLDAVVDYYYTWDILETRKTKTKVTPTGSQLWIVFALLKISAITGCSLYFLMKVPKEEWTSHWLGFPLGLALIYSILLVYFTFLVVKSEKTCHHNNLSLQKKNTRPENYDVEKVINEKNATSCNNNRQMQMPRGVLR